MHFTPATAAAVLLALTPSALALGKAKVVNYCGSSAWFASVPQNIAVAMAELPTDGYEETYSLPNVGVSIKLSPESAGKVTQFEYTWAGNAIYYDISNIDGFPFTQGGMSLVPSEAGCDGYPTCQAVVCHAGQDYCDGAYNNPDDVRTMVCPDTSDLVMTLCPDLANSTSTSTTPNAPSGTSSSTPSQWTHWWGGSKREAEPHSHGHRVHARHLK